MQPNQEFLPEPDLAGFAKKWPDAGSSGG